MAKNQEAALKKILTTGILETRNILLQEVLPEPQFNDDAIRILEKRYLLKDTLTGEVIETPREFLARIAAGVTNIPAYRNDAGLRLEVMRRYYTMMANLDFLPNSPTLMNAGKKDGQLSACFTIPVPDSLKGIMQAVTDVALVHQTGGGTGMDFSQLRPANDPVHSTAGVSSGPVSFMKIFDATTEQIKAGGARRGANMGILKCDHPDILEFIKCKDDKLSLSNFNISVAITDAFMKAMEQDEDYDLINPHSKAVTGTLSAREVWKLLVEHAWTTGDPGIVFIDKMNADNPLKGEAHRIRATNPCVVGDTKVLTRDGDIPIVELVGKTVDVWNGEEWSTVEPRVTGENQPVLAVDFSNGVRLVCTPYHGFWTKGGKIEAKDLQVGDRLGNALMPDGAKLGGLAVTAIEDAGIADKVYCFTEPKLHRGTFNGIVTANCGEQPLEDFEACNLGSVNLKNFINRESKVIDFSRLGKVVENATRFLNDVVDASVFPLPEITAKVAGNRKIGLGLMGFADILVDMEIPYGTKQSQKLARKIMKFINDTGVKTSHEIALRDGSFPNWSESTWKDRDFPMRNATITTIAPTGTLSMLANSSSGIEPLFSLAFVKTVMDNQKFYYVHAGLAELLEKGEITNADFENIKQMGRLSDKMLKEFPYLMTAFDVTPEEHVEMQAAFQEFTHNACSKTINMPKDATIADVDNVYKLAYYSACKGTTIYRDGSKEGQVLTTGSGGGSGDKKATAIDELGVRKPIRVDRGESLDGKTVKIRTGCGSLYVTISVDMDGRPLEVFCRLGKSGGCSSANMEVYGRLISGWLRSGMPVDDLTKQLRGISCSNPAFIPGGRTLSCADAVGIVLERYENGQFGRPVISSSHIIDDDDDMTDDNSGQNSFTKIALKSGSCPECGGPVEYEGGCAVCKICAHSKCG